MNCQTQYQKIKIKNHLFWDGVSTALGPSPALDGRRLHGVRGLEEKASQPLRDFLDGERG